MQTSNNNLNNIPVELVKLIARDLPLRGIVALSQTCRRTRLAINAGGEVIKDAHVVHQTYKKPSFWSETIAVSLEIHFIRFCNNIDIFCEKILFFLDLAAQIPFLENLQRQPLIDCVIELQKFLRTHKTKFFDASFDEQMKCMEQVSSIFTTLHKILGAHRNIAAVNELFGFLKQLIVGSVHMIEHVKCANRPTSSSNSFAFHGYR